MIRINNKEYVHYNTKVSWGNFETVIFDKKEIGISPFITFNIEDNIAIGIETRISKEKLKSINIGEVVNLDKYITDIVYEDKKGWVSIIDGKRSCSLSKIIDDIFLIEFSVDFEEQEEFNIIINSEVELA